MTRCPRHQKEAGRRRLQVQSTSCSILPNCSDLVAMGLENGNGYDKDDKYLDNRNTSDWTNLDELEALHRPSLTTVVRTLPQLAFLRSFGRRPRAARACLLRHANSSSRSLAG